MSTTTPAPPSIDTLIDIELTIDINANVGCQAPEGCDLPATWHMMLTHIGDTTPCSGLLLCDHHKATVIDAINRTRTFAGLTGGRVLTKCNPHQQDITVEWREL